MPMCWPCVQMCTYVYVTCSDAGTFAFCTRDSAVAEIPRDALCKLKSYPLLQDSEKIRIWKGEWPWKSFKVIRKWRYSI